MGVIAYQRETGKTGSNGYVSKTVHLMITNYVNGSILKANEMGIISCKSSYFINGCFSSIAGALVPVTDDSGWFNTNDIGYYDSDGDIYVLDRKKYIIQYKESYFLPINIEQVLLKHPEVEDTGVIPIFNTFDCHHPLAFVVRKEGSKVTEEELIQFIAENITDCMKLRAGVLFRQELKYLPNGWLDRRTLCKWAKDDLKDKVTEEELKQFVAEYSNCDCMHFRMSVLVAIGLPVFQNGFLDRKEIYKMAAKYLYSKMPLSGNRETSLWKYY